MIIMMTVQNCLTVAVGRCQGLLVGKGGTGDHEAWRRRSLFLLRLLLSSSLLPLISYLLSASASDALSQKMLLPPPL